MLTALSGDTNRTMTWRWTCSNRPVARWQKIRPQVTSTWKNTALWTGAIKVGGSRDSSRATAVYSPVGAEKLGVLVSEVSGQFAPTRKP